MLPWMLVVFALLAALLITSVFGKQQQWMFQSEKKWDAEWKAGQWGYMDKVAVERSKVAVMGVLGQMYASHLNGSVLDVGCGEGSLADFLTPEQRSKYVGVDLSREAVQVARRKRPALRFVHAAAHHFKPRLEALPFSLIFFADMLYYVEHEEVLKQYEDYLDKGGIVVISIFHHSEELMYLKIFEFARTLFEKIDEMEVAGVTKKQAHGSAVVTTKVAFHIEAYRKRNGTASTT